MASQDRGFVLTFNGEIFNYVELRRELVGQGVAFKTATDTEVLLEACARWGLERTLPRLVGMFAFALWDAEEESLTLVRDRVGEKPLVYFWNGSTFAFASEMQALRDLHGNLLDTDAVDAYFALGYVPAPLGIFRHTRKLQPGHFLRWSKGSIETARWWRPEDAETAAPNDARNPEIAREKIADAVRLRLRADVPIALALSGGVDSSVIAAELEQHGTTADAFTVVFDQDESDLPYADAVAKKFDLRWEVIRARSADAVTGIEEAVRHYDEPLADSSCISGLALARALRGHFKVILNGDGGDEAFAGYSHYEFIGVKQAIKAAAAAVGLSDGASRDSVYVESKVLFRRSERRALMEGREVNKPLSALLEDDQFQKLAPPGALKAALWKDRHLYLSNDLTYKMDIALAAYGMEGRSPLLDHRILEWTQGLATNELVQGGRKKVLLRRAYADLLPAGILNRKKHGFGAPIAALLRGALAERVAEVLPSPLLEKQAQKATSGQRLWTLLTFACWAKTWGARW